MVCEYAIFTFPGCKCPALVPVRFCPHHLDPKHPAFEPNPEARKNPARITMLFKEPAIPLVHEDYMWMIRLYNDPLLVNYPYTEDERTSMAWFRDNNIIEKMQQKVKTFADGSTLPTVGFHTKICRYHVIYPECQDIQIWRVSEPFFPFLETTCFTHSNNVKKDSSKKGWGIYTQPIPEKFEEPFIERYKRALNERSEALASKETPVGGYVDNSKSPYVIKEDFLEEDVVVVEDDEGSEYQDSGADESVTEEPTAKAVETELEGEGPSSGQGKNKSYTDNQATKIKKYEVQLTESERTIAKQKLGKAVTKIKENTKKKKNLQKRRGNGDSDSAFEDTEASECSDESTVTKKKKPAGKKPRRTEAQGKKVEAAPPRLQQKEIKRQSNMPKISAPLDGDDEDVSASTLSLELLDEDKYSEDDEDDFEDYSDYEDITKKQNKANKTQPLLKQKKRINGTVRSTAGRRFPVPTEAGVRHYLPTSRRYEIDFENVDEGQNKDGLGFQPSRSVDTIFDGWQDKSASNSR
ncbi:hypothetical protein ABW20_dc0101529 [Dactylellina cionopaga]|nr:hypothetical protein ABW20_dc0101529 [Dactylellina cionopaga]